MLRAYGIAMREPVKDPWTDCKDSVQESAILMVKSFLDGTVKSPREQHDLWQESMKRAGWRFGPKLDAAHKLHNQLLPFDQLPELVRLRHSLWRETASEMAVAVGLPSNVQELLAIYWPQHVRCPVQRLRVEGLPALVCLEHQNVRAFADRATANNVAFNVVWLSMTESPAKLEIAALSPDSEELHGLLKLPT